MRETHLYNLCIDVLISGNAKIQILITDYLHEMEDNECVH